MLRDGEVQDISIFDLLVGDVMLFETGDILPADAIIFTGHGIRSVICVTHVYALLYGFLVMHVDLPTCHPQWLLSTMYVVCCQLEAAVFMTQGVFWSFGD